MAAHCCGEFAMRTISFLFFDEVQSGMGMTGKNWCCQHFDVLPDLLVFGKKAQVCGVMAGPRLDEVKDNVFRLPSRISSTWGGNFCDYVRSTHFLRIIERKNWSRTPASRRAPPGGTARRWPANIPPSPPCAGAACCWPSTCPTEPCAIAFWNGAYRTRPARRPLRRTLHPPCGPSLMSKTTSLEALHLNSDLRCRLAAE